MQSQGHEPHWGTKQYVAIFGLLMVFTLLTVGAAKVDMGQWNIVVALAIAGVKAGLVLWFFMHLRTEYRWNWIFAGMGFFFVAILIGLTLSDMLTREGDNVVLSSPKYKVTQEHH